MSLQLASVLASNDAAGLQIDCPLLDVSLLVLVKDLSVVLYFFDQHTIYSCHSHCASMTSYVDCNLMATKCISPPTCVKSFDKATPLHHENAT